MTYDDRPYCFVCDRRVERTDWAEHHDHIDSAQVAARVGAVYDENRRFSNALQWIRMQAGLHYLGQAFEPEHMRNLANLAGDALSGTGEIADFAAAMDEAEQFARERAEKLNGWIE